MHIFSSQKQETRGFAVLYAVIVIAVISSLGAVLSNLLVRESSLSATSRQSSRAFYSADAGQECALYWDLQEDNFDNPDESGSPSHDSDISCSGQDGITITDKEVNSYTYEYSFSISSSTADVCVATTTVTKQSTSSRLITKIETIGNNSCGGSPDVQRALRTTY